MRLLHQIETEPTLRADFPRALCHNDCHMGNLLRDKTGQLVWSDWQEEWPAYLLQAEPAHLLAHMQRIEQLAEEQSSG